MRRTALAASLVVASCGLVMTVPQALDAGSSSAMSIRVPTGGGGPDFAMAGAIEAWKQQIGKALAYMAAVRASQARDRLAQAAHRAARNHRTQPTPSHEATLRRSSSPPSTSSGVADAGGGGGSVAACVRHIESRGNYQAHNPSGADGAYQYMPGTWRSYARLVPGASSYSSAGQAPPAVQDAVFHATLAAGGGSNWSGPDGCTGH